MTTPARTYHYINAYGVTATKTTAGKSWTTTIFWTATKHSAAEVVTKRHRCESGADARLKRFTPA